MDTPIPKKSLIVANWKMYNDISDSIKLVTTLKNIVGEISKVEPVLAPPFTSLYSVWVTIQETPFKLAAQNCFWEDEGPYTGEVSAPFLKDLGCDYVILGHSERRMHFGETDEMINKKIHAALSSELTPIFCIGETEKERKENKTFAVLEQQIRRGLNELSMHDLESFVIAYEPVWAIGTGNTATPSQIEEVHTHLRFFLSKLYDAPTANGIRLIYGGSVKPENSKEVMQINHVDGLLVGSASLEAEKFSKIIHFQNEVTF